MSHSAHLTIVGAKKFTGSCDYSLYIYCVTVSKKSPANIEFCVSCTSGYFPPLTWYEAIYSVKTGEVYKKIVGSFYPNPGNPSEDTIKAKKKVKNSHGVVKYFQYVEACFPSSSGSCLIGDVGIATQ